MNSNNHYKLQVERFKKKLSFTKNDKAIHIGMPTREWEIELFRKEVFNKKTICDLGSGLCKFILECVKSMRG